MKKLPLIICILVLSSCSLSSSKDEKIETLELELLEKQKHIEVLQKKSELTAKIQKEKAKKQTVKLRILEKHLENLRKNTSQEKGEKLKEDILPDKIIQDIPFYSQFPLPYGTEKYEEPYQNFCEEASLLNAYYYFTEKTPTNDEYITDLHTLRELEDILFVGGYKHTSLEQSLDTLIAFQGEEQIVSGEIVENPTIQDIQTALSKKKLVIAPVYGRGLTNPLFRGEGPVYHNLLITGYKDDIFITHEVGVSKGKDFKYKQKQLLENIYDYDPKLYPDNFTKGVPRILILSL